MLQLMCIKMVRMGYILRFMGLSSSHIQSFKSYIKLFCMALKYIYSYSFCSIVNLKSKIYIFMHYRWISDLQCMRQSFSLSQTTCQSSAEKETLWVSWLAFSPVLGFWLSRKFIVFHESLSISKDKIPIDLRYTWAEEIISQQQIITFHKIF